MVAKKPLFWMPRLTGHPRSCTIAIQKALGLAIFNMYQFAHVYSLCMLGTAGEVVLNTEPELLSNPYCAQAILTIIQRGATVPGKYFDQAFHTLPISSLLCLLWTRRG